MPSVVMSNPEPTTTPPRVLVVAVVNTPMPELEVSTAIVPVSMLKTPSLARIP